MGVVTTKSSQITNRDAVPRVFNDAIIEKGILKSSVGTLETTGTDSTASLYMFCQIPSNARVSDVLLSCDGNNTNGTMDIGIYKNTADGGAVVDANFFATAQALGTALKKSSMVHQSGVYGIEDVEKPLWQALGLTSDPNLIYDVVGTIVTADDSADSVTLEVLFV